MNLMQAVQRKLVVFQHQLSATTLLFEIVLFLQNLVAGIKTSAKYFVSLFYLCEKLV
jgi:hypothetical protein